MFLGPAPSTIEAFVLVASSVVERIRDEAAVDLEERLILMGPFVKEAFHQMQLMAFGFAYQDRQKKEKLPARFDHLF